MAYNNGIETSDSNAGGGFRQALTRDELVEAALRHRWLILCTTIFSVLLTLVYLLRATPVYTSTARLYVEQTGPKIISEYEGIMTRSKNYLYTQRELIMSTPIVADAGDELQSRGLKTFDKMDNAVGFLKKALLVDVGKKDDIISISIKSPYPQEAAQIVNSVMDSYVKYHSTRTRSTVLEVLRILQKEKLKRDQELSEKFAAMLTFTRENGVIPIDKSGGHIVFQTLSRLSEALTEAQLTTINAKADYEAAQSMAAEPVKVRQFAMAGTGTGVNIFVSDEQSHLRSELKDLETELRNARIKCTDDHPLVRLIHEEIALVNAELDRHDKEFADTQLEIMHKKWITAKKREEELHVSFESQMQAARELSVKTAEYAALQSELGRTERLCEILDERIKELNVTEDAGALNITILEVGRPGSRPTEPQKARLMSLGLLFGLMIGFCLAVARDWLDFRLRSSEEISAVLGIPVLGVIPSMSEERTVVVRGQRVWSAFKSAANRFSRHLREGVFAGAGPTGRGATASDGDKKTTQSHGRLPVGSGDVVTRGQQVCLEPWSIVAEAYRTVRTAVFFGVPRDQAKTILVTSPAPSEGKSTLVSNLGIAMAQAGQKTLIFDADFRKPMQHRIFKIEKGLEEGFSALYGGIIPLEQAIRPGPVDGLDILTRGREFPNPSEVLNSDAFAELLNRLGKRYDRVIVDSPPVTPLTDGQILGAVCDVVVLVLRAEQSTRKLSQQARDSLLSVGAHLLGVVVNDVPRRRGRYGYYSGYGYSHSYYKYGYGYGTRKGEHPPVLPEETAIRSRPMDEVAAEKVKV